MRHLIERVLELTEEEQVAPVEAPPSAEGHATDEELRSLLESLQPRIGVYGVGGAGCNAANRLFDEGLFENTYVTGYAINTDAQALLMSAIECSHGLTYHSPIAPLPQRAPRPRNLMAGWVARWKGGGTRR